MVFEKLESWIDEMDVDMIENLCNESLWIFEASWRLRSGGVATCLDSSGGRTDLA